MPENVMEIDDEGFIASVADTVALLDQLAEAYLGIGERFAYVPAAESLATAEISMESRFTNARWHEPVAEAHSSSGILAFAGIDHLRSYAHLFASSPIPVYSHLVLARASLEAFGWARWLADRRIDVETRIKRGGLYQLADGLQRKRFPAPEMKVKGQEIILRIREGAPAGWTVVCNDRNLEVGGEAAPAVKDLIGAVLTQGAGPTPAQLGASLWGLLSGIAHAVRYALAFSMEAAPRTSELEPLLAGLSTNSSTVHLVGVATTRGAISGCDERLGLLGWDQDEIWRSAVARCEQHILAVLAATDPAR